MEPDAEKIPRAAIVASIRGNFVFVVAAVVGGALVYLWKGEVGASFVFALFMSAAHLGLARVTIATNPATFARRPNAVVYLLLSSLLTAMLLYLFGPVGLAVSALIYFLLAAMALLKA